MTTQEAMQNIEVAIRKEVRVSVEIAEALLLSIATIKQELAEKADAKYDKTPQNLPAANGG